MKKMIAIGIVFALFLAFIPVPVMAAEGDTGTEGHFSWRELADGTVEITDYTGGLDVSIPGTLAGRTVTAIGEMAFNFDSIQSVVLPDSVKTIGRYAFLNCYNLSTITFGTGLERIGENAFYNAGLTAAYLPESLKTIGDGAFFSCRLLASVTFGSRLESIGQQAFRETKLSSIALPDSLITIGRGAFWDCTLLTTAAFGSGLESIGDDAFGRCPLVSLTFPNSLKSIGSSAFYECTHLITVTFGSGLTSIGDDAFYKAGLTSAALPDSLLTIGATAFGRCLKLTSVTFGNSLQSIGDAAFLDTPIQAAVLPDSLLTIGEGAFSQCGGLLNVTFGSSLQSIGRWGFSHCNRLVSIVLPASLQTLGPWAFIESALLDKVAILSKDAASLHVGAFAGCPLANGIWGFAGSAAELAFASVGYPFRYLYTVSFDTGGGSALADAIIEDGGLVSKPADPVREHYTFGGWYADELLLDAWDFAVDTAKGDGTLHAKWTPVNYTVSFDSRGGSVVEGQTVPYNSALSKPENPTLAGYKLRGWYADEACTQVVPFPYTVKGDVTLYARWAVPVSGSFLSRMLTDAASSISVSGTLNEDASLTVTNNSLHPTGTCAACDAMRQRMADDDYALILGKDISLSQGFIGLLTITMPVGTQYNGETVTILHCKNGMLNTYSVVVVNGKAAFDVSSLSPFAVFAGAQDDLAPIPQTGDGGCSPIWWLLCAGIILTLFRYRYIIFVR